MTRNSQAGKTAVWARLALFAVVTLLIAGAGLLTFQHVWRTDPANLSGRYDIYRYYGPLTYFVDTRIAAGEFPFWNPLTYCGVPNTGNPQSFVFYPPNLIRSLLSGPPTPERTLYGMCVMWALHLLLMGVSMFYFARAHRLSVAASFAAAIVLIFSALVVRRMGEFHFLTTLAWLPAILLCVKAMLDARRGRMKLFFALGAGLLLGLSILGGFLQIVNLMGVTIASYGFFYVLLEKRCARGWIMDFVCLALVVVAGSLVAAATLLPAAELTAYTVRQKGMATPLFSNLQTWGIMKFLQNLIVFPGMSYESETIHLSGVISIVLAAAAFTHWRRRRIAIFALMGLIFVDCSFGPPFPLASLLNWLTPFSQSAYSRAWDFFMVPFGMLAGFGLDAVLRPSRRPGPALARSLFLLIVGAFCLVPMYVWLQGKQYLNPRGEVLIIPAAAVAVIAVASSFRLDTARRWGFAAVFVLLLLGETLAWNLRYVPWLANKSFSEYVPIREGMTELPLANTRDADPISNRYLYSLRFAMNGVDPLHFGAVRDILSGPPRDRSPHRLITNWETTRENNRGNLLFKRSFWLSRQYCPGPLPGKEELFPSAAAVFLGEDAPAELPRVERGALTRRSMSPEVQLTPLKEHTQLFRAVQGGRQTLTRFEVTLPASAPGEKAGSAGALHSALALHYRSAMPGTLETWIAEPGSDRSTHAKRQTFRATGSQEDVLEIPLPDYPKQSLQITVAPATSNGGAFQVTQAYVMSDLEDEDGKIQVDARGANFAALTVGPLDGPRVLSYLDAYYPGWKVFVDGAEAPMLVVDQEFKGVFLKAGTHEVRFAFEPTLTWIAIGISVGSAVAAVAGMLLLLFGELRRSSRDPNATADAAGG